MRCSLLLLSLGALACARTREQPAQSAHADSTVVAETAATAATTPPGRVAPPAFPVMRAAPEPQGGEPHELVGTWDLSTPSGLRSPSLSLTIDSVRGGTIFGRMVRALSGDIELGPDSFKPFQGTLRDDGTFHARIESTQRDAPATEIGGRMTEDGWTGTSMIWGGEELAGNGKTFSARKAR